MQSCPKTTSVWLLLGRAFHRLNRPLIAQRSTRWLRSGGYFIDIGADSKSGEDAGLYEATTTPRRTG